MDTDKTQKPFYPNWKHAESIFLKIISRKFFVEQVAQCQKISHVVSTTIEKILIRSTEPNKMYNEVTLWTPKSVFLSGNLKNEKLRKKCSERKFSKKN